MVEGAGAETRGGAVGWREGRFIAPENALDSKHRFTQIERLDDVVVRSMLEPDDPVELTVLARNHYQGHIPNCPYLPRQLQPIGVTQLQIESHEIDLRLKDHFERLLLIRRLKNVKTFPCEGAPKNPAHSGLVINDKNIVCARHFDAPTARGTLHQSLAYRQARRP